MIFWALVCLYCRASCNAKTPQVRPCRLPVAIHGDQGFAPLRLSACIVRAGRHTGGGGRSGCRVVEWVCAVVLLMDRGKGLFLVWLGFGGVWRITVVTQRRHKYVHVGSRPTSDRHGWRKCSFCRSKKLPCRRSFAPLQLSACVVRAGCHTCVGEGGRQAGELGMYNYVTDGSLRRCFGMASELGLYSYVAGNHRTVILRVAKRNRRIQVLGVVA